VALPAYPGGGAAVAACWAGAFLDATSSADAARSQRRCLMSQ
jgi:hypothetical protein